jgi:hypothetical protein
MDQRLLHSILRLWRLLRLLVRADLAFAALDLGPPAALAEVYPVRSTADATIRNETGAAR